MHACVYAYMRVGENRAAGLFVGWRCLKGVMRGAGCGFGGLVGWVGDARVGGEEGGWVMRGWMERAVCVCVCVCGDVIICRDGCVFLVTLPGLEGWVVSEGERIALGGVFAGMGWDGMGWLW